VQQVSSAELVLGLALCVLWAWLGYRLSEYDRRTLGRTPWGLPSAIWAVFWFIFVLLGLVLYLIAHSTGVRRAQQNPQQIGAASLGPQATMGIRNSGNRTPTAAEQFPAYPRPANSQPQTDSEPTPAPEHITPPGADGGGPDTVAAQRESSPPAWHPDPSGRFHYRWWDGKEWTSQVSTDGHHLIDTNPDQRIGPY
jgi:hypothetical protein